jgi:GxxExxY protein
MTMPNDGTRVPKEWNEITNQIIGAAIDVHSLLGPGLLESLYEQAMVHEIGDRGLRVERQRPIRVRYKTHELGNIRIDLVVEELVVVELKCIERLAPVHAAQLLSYLRSADLPLGLLINFNHVLLTDGVTRRINPHCSLLKNPSLPLR